MYTSLPTKQPWIIGVHVWNLGDSRTPQMTLRAAGLNHKGAFTRLREPKLAAHRLREVWARASSKKAAKSRPEATVD